MKKRFLSLVLALALLCALFPASALSVFALDDGYAEIGNCGDYLCWSYDLDHNILEIYGYGSMEEFAAEEDVPWHEHRAEMVSLTLPDGMTNISSYAFTDCVNLTEVNIPGSVTKLGVSAFQGCTGLTAVELPESITELGSAVFSGCTGLTAVDIPVNVTEIPSGAFYSCTGLRSVSLPDGLETIKINAFYQCSNLSSINFPEGLTRIGVGAFTSCINLSYITLPDSLTTIGQGAFFNCNGLTCVKLPAGVSSVGGTSFEDCCNLSDIIILNPDCVLGEEFASSSVSLTIWGHDDSTASDYAAANSIPFCSIDHLSGECGAAGDNLLWSLDMNTGALTITGSGAMKNYDSFSSANRQPWYKLRKEVTSVSLPDGITAIGKHAFYDFHRLNAVEIPESVTSIGTWAFDRSGLTSVTIPGGVTVIQSGSFSDCFRLSSVTLCEGVVTISEDAFYASALTSVSIPDSVTTIEDGAFYLCDKLLSITIPDSVTHLGAWALGDCSSLVSAELPAHIDALEDHLFYRCSRLSSVAIPDSVTSIGEYAFTGCHNLPAAAIPESVTSIGPYAFYNCGALTDLIIYKADCALGANLVMPSEALTIWGHDDSTAHDYAVAHGIPFTSLDHLSGECGANGDNLLWTLDLNTGALTFTGSGAMAEGTFPWFLFRDQVLSLSLPEGLTSIGAFAFTLCGNLTAVQLPDTVTSINNNAFSACRGLTEISLPAGLTAIGDQAFYGCSGLTAVTIPDSVNSIGEGAFAFCTALTTAVLPEGCTCVEEGLFNHCAALRDLTLPTGLTAIGEASFTGCVSLTEISFPNTLTAIGEQAFKGSGLRSVSIPASVSSIGDLAFDIYETLNDVTVYNPNCEIGEDVYTLGDPLCTTLYGYQNSTLQACAEAFGYRFCPLDQFADVKPIAWYAVPVAWAYDNEITAGTGSSSFSPNKPCTREQVMTFLWRACGSPEPALPENPFEDVLPSAYYYNAVLWAYWSGISSGVGENQFGVGRPCTRCQVMTFLWSALGRPEPIGTDSPFADVQPGKYYYKAVLWAMQEGITGGTSATTFSPNATCTRGQVVTFLYRAFG